MENIQTTDWSAVAAWIALIVSIVGTIAGPLITTILTNRHQIKLREMDNRQKIFELHQMQRHEAITSFISKTGKWLAYNHTQNLMELGEVFHCVYQYVPTDLWPTLDEFYFLIKRENILAAKEKFPEINHKLTEILKEPLQWHP